MTSITANDSLNEFIKQHILLQQQQQSQILANVFKNTSQSDSSLTQNSNLSLLFHNAASAPGTHLKKKFLFFSN